MAKIHFFAQNGPFFPKIDFTSIEATGATFDSIELGKKQIFFRDPIFFCVSEISAPEISTVLPARIGQILAFLGRFLKNIRFSTTQRQNLVHVCQRVLEDVF